MSNVKQPERESDSICGQSSGLTRMSGLRCSFSRVMTLIVARNKEFYRDRSAFLWNIFFPFLIIVGFGVMFSDGGNSEYKIGIVSYNDSRITGNAAISRFLETKHVEFVRFASSGDALVKLQHHKIDMLVDFGSMKYWMSESSPKGYIAEKILAAAGADSSRFVKQTVNLREIPYVEWIFPGILAMNIMFSALFGVGYVVVRYRKNGVLKRMSVTPVHPWEFLTAQVVSRLFVILATTAIVYIGCTAVYRFECRGSYLLLLLVFTLGSFCLISLGLLVACRIESEELANGILNMITWPMMFLSEVWFSLEGTNPWVQKAAAFFPLTYMVDAARKVMNDGASVSEIRTHLMILSAMSVVFLSIGSLFFKWRKD
ncbi:MAG TPA: ABC transporter permease [Spirochaetota bacterium]|nr:ABC transporter permease [Spirochaetota bacterium]